MRQFWIVIGSWFKMINKEKLIGKKEIMIKVIADFYEDEDGFIISFPDLTKSLTQGNFVTLIWD